MKTLIKWLPTFIIIACISTISYCYTKDAALIRKMRGQQSTLTDSIGRMNVEMEYLKQLIQLNQNDRNKELSDTISAYEVHDLNRKHPQKLSTIFASGKKKLIIRYTEIGCNSCADSTFKLLRSRPDLSDKYDILVLVDFSNFEYYVKWKKIAEINDPVLWVKSENLPFPAEKEKASYLFVIDASLKATSFFIPNSRFVPYLREYLKRL